MKTEQVTYDKFSQTVQKMIENGEKLTVRSVLSRTGGSFGKISDFLKRFEQERAYLNLSKQSDISDTLRQSILSEVGRAVGETRAALETQLQQLTTHLEEANERLNEQEKTIEENSEIIRDSKEKLTLAQQISKDHEFLSRELSDKLELAIKEKTLAITDAAKSKLQLERSDKDNAEMKQQIRELQSKVEALTSDKYEAEKRSAVAEAKFDQLTMNVGLNDRFGANAT